VSIICAMTDPKTRSVWVGSDTQTCSNSDLIVDRTTPKWDFGGEWAIGSAGNPAARQAAGRILCADLEQSMHELCSGIHDELKRIGWDSRSSDGDPPFLNLGMVVVRKGLIYELEPATIGVWPVDSDFIAIGSGCRFSYGAWAALRNLPQSKSHPRWTLTQCIEAAIEYNTSCGGIAWVSEIKTDIPEKPEGGK